MDRGFAESSDREDQNSQVEEARRACFETLDREGKDLVEDRIRDHTEGSNFGIVVVVGVEDAVESWRVETEAGCEEGLVVMSGWVEMNSVQVQVSYSLLYDFAIIDAVTSVWSEGRQRKISTAFCAFGTGL